MNLKILCGPCVWKLHKEYENSPLYDGTEITTARYPQFSPTEEEDEFSVLACRTWTEIMLIAPEEIMKNHKMPCDECGVSVSIHPTSMWLLEKAGREKEIA